MIILYFFAVLLLGSPIIISSTLGHFTALVFSFFHLHKVTKYYLFWIAFIAACFFSSENRLSIEYFLMTAGFTGAAISLDAKYSKKSKIIFYSLLFLTLFAQDYFKFSFYERGSLLLWMPVFLAALNTELKDIKFKFLGFSLAGVMSFLSNKKTVALAFVASLFNFLHKRKFLFLLVVAFMAITPFALGEKSKIFWRKSVKPRMYFWKYAAIGFLDKPLSGHGFGTFNLDYPEYRALKKVHGMRANDHVTHGHSSFFHLLFEQGLIGLVAFLLLSLIIFQLSPEILLPFLVINFCDTALGNFAQYFIASGVLAFTFKPEHFSKNKFAQIFSKQISLKTFMPIAKILLLVFAFIVFASSITGHFFYDNGRFTQAIKYDPYHPMNYFSRAYKNLDKNPSKSAEDFAKATELAPHIDYFYAFYAAALLADGQIEKAKPKIARALKAMNKDPYIYLLSAFINSDNQEIYDKHYARAIKLDSDIEYLLKHPEYPANEYIGGTASDIRVSSFYRQGPEVYFPLPYFEE